MSKIDKAIAFAVRAHSGQCRKGTRIPYIVHPLGVARILIQCGCPDHVVIAGILHDTVEDTPVTIEEIRREFGRDVAALVDAATEPDNNAAWENRKKRTIEMVQTLSDEAAILVLADKLDNIRAIRETSKPMARSCGNGSNGPGNGRNGTTRAWRRPSRADLPISDRTHC